MSKTVRALRERIELGDAEIEQLHAFALFNILKEDIVRLEITVNNAVAMHYAENIADLFGKSDHFLNSKALAFVDARAQRFAFQILHYQITDHALRAVIINTHRIRMIEPRGGTRFPLEALDRFIVSDEMAVQHFYRDRGIE